VDVSVCPAVRVIDGTGSQTRPAEGLAVVATVPAKPFRELTVTVEVPELMTPFALARILVGVTAPVEMEKSGAFPTVTGTSTVLESALGAVPIVPVTVTVKVLAALQLTLRTFPEMVEVQPAGGVLVTASETVPANPLTALTEIVELPAVPTVVLIEAGLADNEKSWIVTLTLVVLETVLGAVPVVPVTITLNGATPVEQVTERTAPENVAVQPAGTVPAEKVTVPTKPLTGVTVTVDVPGTVASVVIAGADNEKSWTVMLKAVVVLLPVWIVSVAAGVYAALILAVPVAVAVKLAGQVAVPTVALATRVQGEPVKDPAAVPVRVKVTVPDGVVAPVVEVSLTVAVQLDAWFTSTVPVHATEVVVACATRLLKTPVAKVSGTDEPDTPIKDTQEFGLLLAEHVGSLR
jgi:hypothetical protein